MSLKSALRKAAGLLIELPPEEPVSTPASSDDFVEPSKPAGPQRLEKPDIDKLLADAGIKPSAPQRGVSTPAAPPKPEQTKSVEQIVRETPGPNLDEIKASPSDTPLTSDGKVHFTAIYRAAKLPDTPFAAEKMLEMIAKLPANVSLDVKRQMVKVTLDALGQSVGATPENIVADASRKLAALAAYVEHSGKQSTQAAEGMEKEIVDLQKQIETKKAAIETVRKKNTQIVEGCEAESERLDDVLEFFSLDVPPSKYAGQSGSTPPPAKQP